MCTPFVFSSFSFLSFFSSTSSYFFLQSFFSFPFYNFINMLSFFDSNLSFLNFSILFNLFLPTSSNHSLITLLHNIYLIYHKFSYSCTNNWACLFYLFISNIIVFLNLLSTSYPWISWSLILIPHSFYLCRSLLILILHLIPIPCYCKIFPFPFCIFSINSKSFSKLLFSFQSVSSQHVFKNLFTFAFLHLNLELYVYILSICVQILYIQMLKIADLRNVRK